MSLPVPTWNKGDKLSADKLRCLSDNVSGGRRGIRDFRNRSDHKHLPIFHDCVDFEFKVEFRVDPQDEEERKVPAWRSGFIRSYDIDVEVGKEDDWNYVEYQDEEEIDLYLNYETLPNGILRRAYIEKEPQGQIIHQPAAEPGKYSLPIASIDKEQHIIQHWLGSVVHHWIALRNSDDRWGPPWDEGDGYSVVPGVGHVLHKRDGQSWTARRIVAGQNIGITETETAILISAGGGGPGLDISIVPGPGIDAERTDSTAEDGTHIIRYDIKGRLSQYINWQKPDEQGDIVACHIAINPSNEPVPLCYAVIVDGDIQFSIVPGPVTKVVAGNNIEVVETHSDSPTGWPIVTYTVSTKDGGSISIVPGPGIAITPAGNDQYYVEGLTARYNHPLHPNRQGDMTGADILIKPSYNPTPNSIPYIIDGMLEISIVPGPVTRVYAGAGIDVHEHRHEENGWPILSYTVSATGAAAVEIGRYTDPLRPATGYNAAQMEANGWTQVNGYWKDPTGHTHMCFMAYTGGKLYFHMFPDGWDV